MTTERLLSAFAIYKKTYGNQAYNKDNANKSVSNKKKFKAKCRRDHKKNEITKGPAAKRLNVTKVLKSIEQDNINLITNPKPGKVQSKKLKVESVPKVSSLDKLVKKAPKKIMKPNQRPQRKLGKSPGASMIRPSRKRGIQKPRPMVQISDILQERARNQNKIGTFTNPPSNITSHLPSNGQSTSQAPSNVPSNTAPANTSHSSVDKYFDPNPSVHDPIMKGFQLFEWIISPVDPNYFFRRYWESEPLHIPRSKNSYYKHLFSSRHIDQIFRDHNLYYTRNVDVVSYENETKQVLNPEGRAVPSALWDFYSNGCSIRLLNPQTYNKKVHLLISTLQEYFGSMVGVNAYLTPPNSQGFAPHFDDIEAFVIQLEGTKHWKLYQPKPEHVLARHSSKNFTHSEIGEPFLEVALEAGSLLYFPRGVIHEGKTGPDCHSLHLTVSLYQNNAYVDLLEKALPNALAKAATSDIDFRKGLPLHFLRSAQAKEIIVEKITALMDKLKDYLDVDTGIQELGRKLVYDSMPPVLSSEELACSSKQDGDLLDNGVVYNRVEFDLATKVRLTRYHCIQLIHEDNTKPRLYYSTENANVYHGEDEQFLELEPFMIAAVESLQRAYPNYVEVGLLPIDGVELKVQFVYDLWEKGIIITKKPFSSQCAQNRNNDDSDSNSD